MYLSSVLITDCRPPALPIKKASFYSKKIEALASKKRAKEFRREGSSIKISRTYRKKL